VGRSHVSYSSTGEKFKGEKGIYQKSVTKLKLFLKSNSCFVPNTPGYQ
jgi:hypothetical protein